VREAAAAEAGEAEAVEVDSGLVGSLEPTGPYLLAAKVGLIVRGEDTRHRVVVGLLVVLVLLLHLTFLASSLVDLLLGNQVVLRNQD